MVVGKSQILLVTLSFFRALLKKASATVHYSSVPHRLVGGCLIKDRARCRQYQEQIHLLQQIY